MATATETRNGAQAPADEAARTAERTFDAVSDYYLSALDAGLRFQARWTETAKLMLDESAAFQRTNRKLIEELVQNTRRSQQDLQSAFDSNAQAFRSVWMPADKR